MPARIIGLLLVGAITLGLHGKDFPKLTGPWLGQKPPGMTPEIFAPGIVSTPGVNEFCASFSPNGREFYFNRGMTVMVCLLGKDGWSAPEPASFNGNYRNHEAHLAFDNHRMFFGSARPPQGYGIWLTERTANGWSEPCKMWDGMYLTSAISGNLYFGVEFPAPGGIVRIRCVDGRYEDPVRLEVGFGNSRPPGTPIFHPGIAPDEAFVVFDDNQGLYVSFRGGDGRWGDAIPLRGALGEQEATIPSVSPDGKILFYAAHGDLYWVSTQILKQRRFRE